MTVSTVDVLRAARDLYAQAPSHAPKGEDLPAGRYCPLTAIGTASGSYSLARPAENAFYEAVGWVGVVRWSATHSTEEVLAAFDRAIEAEALKVVTA